MFYLISSQKFLETYLHIYFFRNKCISEHHSPETAYDDL